jgi:hypothetical protein
MSRMTQRVTLVAKSSAARSIAQCLLMCAVEAACRPRKSEGGGCAPREAAGGGCGQGACHWGAGRELPDCIRER